MSGDPFWSNVVLAMRMDGANNGTVFTDSKAAKVFTGNVGAVTSTENAKYSASSLKLSGASGCNLTSTTTPTDYQFGTGDFTIEGWFYDNGTYGTVRCLLDKCVAYNTSMDFRLIVNAAGQLEFSVGPTTATVFTGTLKKVPLYAWTYLAVSRVGSTLYMFIDGVLAYTGTAAFNIGNVQSTFMVGSYTSTAALVLGLHCDGADNSTTFTDVTGKTVTPSGNAKLSTTQVKFGTTAAYFDGTGDFITIPNSVDFDFGAGDFTIEMWAFPTVATGYHTLITKSPSTYHPFGVYMTPTRQLEVLCSKNGTAWDVFLLSATNVFTLNVWNHVSVVRTNGFVKGYINGVEVVSGALTGSLMTNSSNVTVGNEDASYGFAGYLDDIVVIKGAALRTAAFTTPAAAFTTFFDSQYTGYMQDLRITKGTGRYSARFTPPQQQLEFFAVVDDTRDPYWTNTKLLLHGETIADTSSFARTLTPTGTAATPYTVAYKYGGGCIRFDGASYISLASSVDFQFGTGDFTIEAWVNLDTISGYNSIFSNNWAAASNDNFVLGVDGGRLSFMYKSSGGVTTPSHDGGSVPVSGWHHVALCRQGDVLFLYIDGYGVAYRAGVSAYSFGYSASLYVGATNTTTSRMTGYIDDLRVTKGTARYPTTPTTFTPVVNVLSSTDPNWSNVYFAEAFNEAHGTTTFTDASGHYTITNSNTVASASNVTAKYGTTSLKFSGAAGGLTLNDKFTWMHDGTTPWTWETWINVSTVPPTVWGLFGNFSTNAAGTNPFIQIYVSPSSTQVSIACTLSGQGTAGAGGYMIVATTAFNVTAWKHVVFEYDGVTLRAYLDGVLAATCTKNGVGGSGSAYTAGTTGNVNAVIGAYSNGSFSFPMPGYIDDMRITKNVARYNAKMFTPHTYAHPEGSSVVSGTVLDTSATLCDRVIHVHSRATGRLLGTATSDPVTGAFSIGSPELCYAVALDSTGNYNALILDRLNPI